MNRKNKKLSVEDKEDLDIVELKNNDPFAFEMYCGSCDNFNTYDCPFFDKVDYDTYYRFLQCKKYDN